MIDDPIANDPEIQALMKFEDQLLEQAKEVGRIRVERADALIDSLVSGRK